MRLQGNPRLSDRCSQSQAAQARFPSPRSQAPSSSSRCSIGTYRALRPVSCRQHAAASRRQVAAPASRRRRATVGARLAAHMQATEPLPTVLVVMGVSGCGKRCVHARQFGAAGMFTSRPVSCAAGPPPGSHGTVPHAVLPPLPTGSTVGALLAARMGGPFIEGDALHPPANLAKMSAGVPLNDDDRWPWLHTLAAIVARHAAAGEPAVLSCSALKPEYRRLLTGAQHWSKGIEGSSSRSAGFCDGAAGSNDGIAGSARVAFVSFVGCKRANAVLPAPVLHCCQLYRIHMPTISLRPSPT